MSIRGKMGRLGVAAILGAFVIGSIALVLVAGVSDARTSSSSGPGSCPAASSLSSYSESSIVGASVGKSNLAWSYFFSSLTDTSSSGGVPGLMQYCVYPTGSWFVSISHQAKGQDGSAWSSVSSSGSGYLGWQAPNTSGNIALSGQHGVKMGSVVWNGTEPSNETVLLEINDAAECTALYGGSSSTCFVYPAGWLHPLCGGMPACKSVSIAEATSTSPLTVPSNTTLHIQYTYTIVDQPWAGASMVFYTKSAITSGMNTTGINDFFTCEQKLDPSGSPGTLGVHPNYEGTGLDLSVVQGGAPCNRLNVTLVAVSSDVVIQPGDFITFTIDLTTGPHGFTGPGTHCINSGAIVKWIPGACMSMMQTYRTPMIDVVVS
ncbi:MAG TPA: hypothetical protein VMH78_06895 [Thermoplasmata archaeon]|nr:hypothetical protein [Thermoplasmata archaeon]